MNSAHTEQIESEDGNVGDDVTEPESHPSTDDLSTSDGVHPGSSPADAEMLRQIAARQGELAEGLERLAQSVTPLLTTQYESTLARVRALEQRILHRQERPTVVKLAQLLTTSTRLRSSDDRADHLSNGLIQVLEGMGYEQFGVVGEQFDETQHEPLDGVECADPIITKVHAFGLRAGDDVVIRARVETGPDSELVDLDPSWEGTAQ